MTVNEILLKARNDAGISQNKLATRLNVSRSTIVNWESGYSSITLENAIDWFRALGVPMYPYLMSALYGDELATVTDHSDISLVRKSLHKYIDELDAMRAKELQFILQGYHGSSPTGTLDMVTAYLHLPLILRVLNADSIVFAYEMSEARNELVNCDHILPRLDTLNKCVSTAKTAAYEGKNSYT